MAYAGTTVFGSCVAVRDDVPGEPFGISIPLSVRSGLLAGWGAGLAPPWFMPGGALFAASRARGGRPGPAAAAAAIGLATIAGHLIEPVTRRPASWTPATAVAISLSLTSSAALAATGFARYRASSREHPPDQQAGSQLPFTHEMVVVHKLFRREFGQGPGWVRRVDAGDTDQAQLVYTHLQKDFDLLHHHHEGEDLELWPRLRERATDHLDLLDAMQDQHRGIDPALAKAAALGEAWAQTADPAAREAFAQAIEETAVPLLAHLNQEESDILPLALQYISEDEWGLLAAHTLASTPKPDLITGLGGVLEDATDEERAMLLRHVPAAAKLLYSLTGKQAYIKEATAVRGVAPVGL